MRRFSFSEYLIYIALCGAIPILVLSHCASGMEPEWAAIGKTEFSRVPLPKCIIIGCAPKTEDSGLPIGNRGKFLRDEEAREKIEQVNGCSGGERPPGIWQQIGSIGFVVEGVGANILRRPNYEIVSGGLAEILENYLDPRPWPIIQRHRLIDHDVGPQLSLSSSLRPTPQHERKKREGGGQQHQEGSAYSDHYVSGLEIAQKFIMQPFIWLAIWLACTITDYFIDFGNNKVKVSLRVLSACLVGLSPVVCVVGLVLSWWGMI